MGPLGNLCPTRSQTKGLRFHALGLAISIALALAAPAAAQWSQVNDIPTTRLPAVYANGDTIVAGADTVVYVSTNSGATFRRSTKPVSTVVSIQAVFFRDGRLYAGTFGQGVHVSDDLGATWSSFNDGLVGGFEDSQLKVTDLVARGDSLYAATAGASVYLRNLDGVHSWQPFGSLLEPEQASNVNSLAVGGGRLLANAGANGMVFRDDPGDVDWTESDLDNIGVHAGLTAQSAIWTGTGWVVGANGGIFRSVAGQEPWTRFNPGFGGMNWTTFATQAGHLFGALDIAVPGNPPAAVIIESGDDGATWQITDTEVNIFVQEMAISGGHLYSARSDGLWRRPLTVTGVGDEGRPNAFQFAIAGPQPFGSGTRVSFDLPRAETISLEIFDVQGRLVGDRIEGRMPSGRHEVALNAERLASGVYLARLTAGGRHQTVRLVHVR